MIRRLLLIALGLLVAAPAAIARETPVTIRAGRLLDRVEDVREGVTITVQGARITDVSAAQRAEPAQHVVHAAEVGQLDQVAVRIADEEQRVAPGRAFGRADAFHAPSDEAVVPPLRVAHVEADVGQADAVRSTPRYSLSISTMTCVASQSWTSLEVNRKCHLRLPVSADCPRPSRRDSVRGRSRG